MQLRTLTFRTQLVASLGAQDSRIRVVSQLWFLQHLDAGRLVMLQRGTLNLRVKSLPHTVVQAVSKWLNTEAATLAAQDSGSQVTSQL